MSDKKIEDYQDIINLPHHVSKDRPHMSMRDRAAQFSPFAALSGYDDAVKETERLTNRRIELDEDEQQKISDRLTMLRAYLKESPTVEITYFIPDDKKAGGEYCTVIGTVKKLDEFQKLIIMMDDTKIPIGEIIDVNGAMFQSIHQPSAGARLRGHQQLCLPDRPLRKRIRLRRCGVFHSGKIFRRLIHVRSVSA